MKRWVPVIGLAVALGGGLAAAEPRPFREALNFGLSFMEPRLTAERPEQFRGGGRPSFVPLEAILRAIKRSHSGHQIGVNGPAPLGERYVYRIKWLTDDGAVLYVIADAETGAILSTSGG